MCMCTYTDLIFDGTASERGAGQHLVSSSEYASGGRKGKSKNKLETHGLSWTEQEHRRFLEGLERFGVCMCVHMGCVYTLTT